MARLNDDAQWIVLMAFLVSFSFFFLAIVINQSTAVGQTTAESVIEFPKNDIRDVRHIIGKAVMEVPYPKNVTVSDDITNISMSQKGAVVYYTNITSDNVTYIQIHYNNGVTRYHENWTRR